MNYYLSVLKNYAVFSGRASRREYWMFILFNIIFAIVAAVLDSAMGTNFKMESMGTEMSLPYGYIYLLYSLAVFIPGLAVSVRRLHDIGKSGWNFLIVLIPFIGAIWLIVLMATAGNEGENDYGPDPYAGEEEPVMANQ